MALTSTWNWISIQTWNLVWMTLHRMMQDGEPQLVSGAAPAPAGRSESQLRRMMQDPRYWRDHDTSFAAEVRRGFEDLYPDEG